MTAVQESVQAFLKYRDPPAPNAPERDWRSFFLYHLLALRHGQEVLRADIAKISRDLEVQRQVDVEAEAATRGQATDTARRVAGLAAEVGELSKGIDRLSDEADRICRAVGIPLPVADDDPVLPAGATS
jgi:hypothetical protein